ncbi:MAG: endonuclease/exonuclease/phosphatase family protein [Dehalococcoidia bacterium]
MTTAVERRAPPRLRGLADAVATLYVAGLTLLMLASVVAPQRAGPLALAQIFAPYLFLPVAGLALVAIWPGGRIARLAVAGGALLWALLFLPGLISVPTIPAPDAQRITVASWNTLQDNDDAEALRSTILDSGATVVAIQELSPEQAELLASDPAIGQRFRHRALYGRDRYLGIGILSAYPILEEGTREFPPVVWARIDVRGRSVLVVNAHPLPGRIAWLHVGSQALPVGFNGVPRDDQITTILAMLDALRKPGEPLLLVGDFNITEREPAYRELTAHLQDAKRAAGFGFQNTWKSWFLLQLPLAVLRIDYLFAGPGVDPVGFATDCRVAGSDHCLIRGQFEISPGAVP